MTLEGLKAIFEIGGVVLLFLTFICGTGALYTSGIINRRQSAELRDFQLRIEGEQQKTAAAQEAAAKAQLELRQTLTVFAKRAGDRILDIGKFQEGLRGKPRKTVEILYKQDDIEAERFSGDIHRALQGAGWPVSRRVLKAEDALGGMSLAKTQGIMLVSRNHDDFMFTLLRAIQFGGQAVGITAPEVPEGAIVVVIGTKDKL